MFDFIHAPAAVKIWAFYQCSSSFANTKHLLSSILACLCVLSVSLVVGPCPWKGIFSTAIQRIMHKEVEYALLISMKTSWIGLHVSTRFQMIYLLISSWAWKFPMFTCIKNSGHIAAPTSSATRVQCCSSGHALLKWCQALLVWPPDIVFACTMWLKCAAHVLNLAMMFPTAVCLPMPSFPMSSVAEVWVRPNISEHKHDPLSCNIPPVNKPRNLSCTGA